jgi:hypothetical protein
VPALFVDWLRDFSQPLRTDIMTLLANRHALAIAAMTLLTAPLAASADDAATMDACIQTFVAASLPKGQPVRILTSGPTPRALGAPGREYKIVLTATGTSTGKQLAKATCTVDRNRAVMAMNGKLVRVRTADAVVPAAEQSAAR